eukprot:gene2793-3086_t
MGFVKAGEHTNDQQQPGGPTSSVVILAPKQAANTNAAPRQSNILGIRRVLQQKAVAAGLRPPSPSSPAAGPARGSPVYESFKTRCSPTQEHYRASRYSEEERRTAWREQAAEVQHIRRGKQGLGFSSNTGKAPAAAGTDRSLTDAAAKLGLGSSSGNSRRKGVQGLDAAAHIPGYEQMTAAEKLKARMRLVMQHAGKQQQQQGASVAEDAGGTAWTRFVFDEHGELDEDKAARQALMDREVGQGGIQYDAADADGGVLGTLAAAGEGGDHNVGAAFIMGTGRAAARRANVARAKESAHEDAIFGRPYMGAEVMGLVAHGLNSKQAMPQGQEDYATRGLGCQQPGAAASPATGATAVAASAAATDNHTGADDSDTQQLADSLGVSQGLLVAQPAGKQSWRERALALKAKKQL